MKEYLYYQTVAIVFSVIGIVHLVRALQGWEIEVSGAAIPVWVSWAAFIIAGYLAIRGFQMAQRK